MGVLEEFEIQPSTNLLDVLASEYTFNSAVADLVDNCIDGKANSVRILIEYRDGHFNLHIIDNGVGMSKEKLSEAAKIAFKSAGESRELSALGRYSTGLKSAAAYLCKSLVVCSKVKNKEPNILLIPFSEIKRDEKWTARFLDSYEKSDYIPESGTIVSCLSLNHIHSMEECFNKLEELRTYLNRIFGKFLIDQTLSINVGKLGNKEKSLEGWDPFSLPHNQSTRIVSSRNYDFKGKNISFKIYILPSFTSLNKEDQTYAAGGYGNAQLNKLQGFYIYRNNRLITEPSWFLPDLDITDKARYARIEVLVPSSLDKYFQINLSKTKFVVPEELKKIFKSVAIVARRESNKNYNYKLRPETKPKLVAKSEPVWISARTNEGLVLRLNKDSIMLRQLAKNLSDSEYERLINFISKTFPHDYAVSESAVPAKFTEADISNLVREFYQNEKELGKTSKEIFEKIFLLEPFCLSKYREIVHATLDEIDPKEE